MFQSRGSVDVSWEFAAELSDEQKSSLGLALDDPAFDASLLFGDDEPEPAVITMNPAGDGWCLREGNS